MGILTDYVKAQAGRIAAATSIDDPVVGEHIRALAQARVAAGNQLTRGATYESGTSVVSGSFFALQAVGSTNTIFSSLVATNWDGDTPSLTLTPGSVIYGDFTSFSLSGGAVLAYKQE